MFSATEAEKVENLRKLSEIVSGANLLSSAWGCQPGFFFTENTLESHNPHLPAPSSLLMLYNPLLPPKWPSNCLIDPWDSNVSKCTLSVWVIINS